MGSNRKKPVVWKDTRTQVFFPTYQHPLSVRNRYMFFWTLGKNYRKMMNFAANFTEPGRICAVYVFGDIGKIETIKAYAEEKKLLALHLPDIQDAINTELSFCKWLDKLKARGLRDGDNPSDIWIDNREKHIRARDNGCEGLDESIAEYNEEYHLWKVDHPAAFENIKNAIADGYSCYGLFDGKMDGSLSGHSAALEIVATRIYPFGIEADRPKEYAYKTVAARKLADSALDGHGADTLGINSPEREERKMSVFKISASCEEAIANKGWFDDHGFKRCHYCGSMDAVELADLIEQKKATMHGCDWKYGWPHKFYVDVENPTPEAQVIKCTHSFHDEEGVRQEKKTYGPEGPTLPMKFYSNHLKLLDKETFEKVAPIISRACGINWTMEDGKLFYASPRFDYQKF